MTNHLTFGATTIAAIYKDRWQIEIWTALIAILILKYLKYKARYKWSLSNLVALLRYNLFTYRNLWLWIDQPHEPPIMMAWLNNYH